MSNGHFSTIAEMSWVRSVLGPKCPYTLSYTGNLQLHFQTNIKFYNGHYSGICCKAIRLQTTLQASQVLEAVFSTSLTGSDLLTI